MSRQITGGNLMSIVKRPLDRPTNAARQEDTSNFTERHLVLDAVFQPAFRVAAVGWEHPMRVFPFREWSDELHVSEPQTVGQSMMLSQPASPNWSDLHDEFGLLTVGQ